MEFIGGDPYQDMWDHLVLGQFTHTPTLLQSLGFQIGWIIIVKFLKDMVKFLIFLVVDCLLLRWFVIPGCFLSHIYWALKILKI